MGKRTEGFKTEEDPQDPHGERVKSSKLSSDLHTHDWYSICDPQTCTNKL